MTAKAGRRSHAITQSIPPCARSGLRDGAFCRRVQERTGNDLELPPAAAPYLDGGARRAFDEDYECRPLARHADKLLQAAHARRHRLAGVGIVLPRGPGNLPDIDVAV